MESAGAMFQRAVAASGAIVMACVSTRAPSFPRRGGFLPEAPLVISGSFVASKPRECNQERQLMCCRIISDKISELLVEGRESMVTYLKTLIYIQDASCAGLRVWPAILDISAGLSFFLHPVVQFCQAWGIWEWPGDGEEVAEGEGGRREVGGSQCLVAPLGGDLCGGIRAECRDSCLNVGLQGGSDFSPAHAALALLPFSSNHSLLWGLDGGRERPER